MPRIVISAGEPSGDYLGAQLIAELRRRGISKENILIIGGPKMEQALKKSSIFPIQDISVMGYVEVILKIPIVFWRLRQAAAKIAEFNPDIIITIDSGGFHFRLVEKLRSKLSHTKFYHYVSPSIWAYRYKRIFKVKKLYDCQFVLFKFEKSFYDKEGIECIFVGHPLVERKFPPYIGYDKRKDSYTISVFCGSREMEIKTLSPIFFKAIELVAKKLNTRITVFVATLDHLKPTLQKIASSYDLDFIISSDSKDREYYIPRSKMALSKSGTISLELMFYNIPILVAHKINSITAFFLKRVLSLKYVSLGNILAKKGIISELLQEHCNASEIAAKIIEIIKNNKDYTKDYKAVLAQLYNGTDRSPSQLICDKVLGAE